ncbi:putative ABC transport system substrate-binding protein [[Clostridium] propionicum DSM 1682]|uniref:ABC transport system substrate-binding protein n=2 Tax=Anaerotignum propionicum TaxID=28446 RepID=A0A0X1U6S8_ANAPI|nr:ABC transporter substrate binding protein [Anaerotignum propionicum DSM 1682]SHE91046.1 putative ABC transport system substrate-binding protein [[Clostridium] propionicum DSM 1682] [Anaerotignum propionicum DSM 1682]
MSMKKFLAFTMATIMSLVALSGCGSSSPQPGKDSASGNVPVIGISQYGQHASLDNCREGFLQGLEESGLVEGKDFTVDYQNAGFDDNITTQIAQNFSANNVALMCAIATPSATACFAAAEDKNIPVIFTAITDPVKAKLDKGNITGTSDKLPIEAQLELIRTLQPDAKTIGILYTTSEPNSVSAIAEYQEKGPSYGFTIETIGVTQQAEVLQAADNMIAKGVDCISNLTDNNVVGVLPSILEKTNEAGIPVYGSEIEQVKIGCVASAGIDYVLLGKQTGAMAAKILKGEAKAEELPYETITSFDTYINSKALADMGMKIPADIAEKAIEAAN